MPGRGVGPAPKLNFSSFVFLRVSDVCAKWHISRQLPSLLDKCSPGLRICHARLDWLLCPGVQQQLPFPGRLWAPKQCHGYQLAATASKEHKHSQRQHIFLGRGRGDAPPRQGPWGMEAPAYPRHISHVRDMVVQLLRCRRQPLPFFVWGGRGGGALCITSLNISL